MRYIEIYSIEIYALLHTKICTVKSYYPLHLQAQNMHTRMHTHTHTCVLLSQGDYCLHLVLLNHAICGYLDTHTHNNVMVAIVCKSW